MLEAKWTEILPRKHPISMESKLQVANYWKASALLQLHGLILCTNPPTLRIVLRSMAVLNYTKLHCFVSSLFHAIVCLLLRDKHPHLRIAKVIKCCIRSTEAGIKLRISPVQLIPCFFFLIRNYLHAFIQCPASSSNFYIRLLQMSRAYCNFPFFSVYATLLYDHGWMQL